MTRPSNTDHREALIDSIDDRRFDEGFPPILYKDIEWLVDNCLLPLFQAREQQLLDELLKGTKTPEEAGIRLQNRWAAQNKTNDGGQT